MKRLAALASLLLALAACDTQFKDLEQLPPPMGRFLLGHTVVVADNPDTVPISRPASDEEWEASLTSAIKERFGRYDGDKYFHIAVHVDGYSLAPPGIPVVAAPKSALIISVTLWDDEKQAKINEEPEQFTVLENLGGNSVIGSGLTNTREEQIENLARNASRMIQNWMLEHIEWFGDASLMDPTTTSPGFPASKIPTPDSAVPETSPGTGTEASRGA